MSAETENYYVVANGKTTYFDVVEDALAFAHQHEGAVLYVNDEDSVYGYFEGIETHFVADIWQAKYRYGSEDARKTAFQPKTTKLVFEAGLYDSILGGGYNPVSGAVNPDFTSDSYEIIFNGGTTANIWAGGRTAGTKFIATHLTTVTVNGGRVTQNLCAVSHNGAVGEAILNVTGGSVAAVNAFTAANTAILEKGLTINVSGGQVGAIYYAGGSAKNLTKLEIVGGVRLNITGGLVTGRISSGAATGSITVTGGMYLNFTGGTIAQDIYGTGHSKGTLTGGVHILIDGVVGNVKCYGAYNMDADTVEIRMKSGEMVSLSGGAAEHDMKVDTTITLDGGMVDYIFGTSGKFFVSTGRSDIVMNGGAVTTLLALNGGTGTGASLIGDATLVVNDGVVSGVLTANGGSAVSEDAEYTGKITGNASITIHGGQFADIIAVNYGSIDGNVSITLDGGSYSGWIDGSKDCVSGKSTLTIAADIATTSEVEGFDDIVIDVTKSAASLTANSITASSVIVRGATAGSSYTLADGFDIQTTAVTIEGVGTINLSSSCLSGNVEKDGVSYTAALADKKLTLSVSGSPIPPPPVSGYTGELVLTITDKSHAYCGAEGGWKIKEDQTIEWQDLSTLADGMSFLDTGVLTAGKAMPDIFITNGTNYVGAYVTDDTGAITGFESVFSGDGALMQIGVADFNADGISDLLLRTSDGFVGCYVNGQFKEVQGLGTEWTVAALGDVDGNGCADVIIAHEAGFVGAYLIGTDGSVSWGDLGNLDANTKIVGSGDFNGDGTDDVLVNVSGTYYGAWTCDKGGVSGFMGIGVFDAEVQQIADYNADGKDDIAFRTADGVVGAALITGADQTTWTMYGALGNEWSVKGVGIL